MHVSMYPVSHKPCSKHAAFHPAVTGNETLTQTPSDISAPASAKAFAMAQPKPCRVQSPVNELQTSEASLRLTLHA